MNNHLGNFRNKSHSKLLNINSIYFWFNIIRNNHTEKDTPSDKELFNPFLDGSTVVETSC